jgi:hypothetical protein
MDAKYKYAFWRPITAIRNGDIDGNDATEREATWQPIDNTPMHPEYPCAHCIISSTVASAIEAMLGGDGRSVPGGCFAHTVSTVEPTVLRDSRSRCACAASFSG